MTRADFVTWAGYLVAASGIVMFAMPTMFRCGSRRS